MKTSIAVFSGLTLLVASHLSPAMAGDREWATAGKVLTGIFAAQTLSRAFEQPPVVQTVYVAPQPVVYQQAPPVYVQQQVYVPAAPVQQVASSVPNATLAPAAPTFGAPAVVTAAAPVVVQQPVYVQPAPVYVTAPAPVYVSPYYYAPRPAINFSIGFGHHSGFGLGYGPARFGHGWGGHRHCW